LIGERLGPYEVTAKLGEGGMGEVWRARDTKLERDVAIKVLPQAFVEDRERLARFEREAKLLAQLNHPNIAQIYGMEASGASHALVMELVAGPTLAERLEAGPLPLEESVALARQIAEALEEAHEKGIVHRDLKPQNIKASIEGKVKVLDFGLAKALDPTGAASGAGSASQLAASPTLTLGATVQGLILGTAAYMAPEQAKGAAVDKRADIWAFGVVLFEMLAGRRLFEGDSVPETLAGVLKSGIDLDALPPEVPPALRSLLRRCLERDPKKRLRDIGEARWVLAGDLSGSADADRGAQSPSDESARSASWRRAVPWAVAAASLALAIAAWSLRPAEIAEAPDAPVSRYNIALPAGEPFHPGGSPSSSLAISNDGRRIAYRASSNAPDLRLRDLGRLAVEPITDLAGAGPFFSPDGDFVAFFSGASLYKASIRGGRPIALARDFANAGWMLGTWCDDNTIVFDTWNGGLRAIPGDGGAVRTLTEPTDEWHLDPRALPGPCRVLFYTQTGSRQVIEMLSLADGARRKILDDASHGRYLASGHLLFVRDGAVQVARFDLDRLEVVGPGVPLPFEVTVDAINASAPTPQLAVSRNGTLVYAPAAAEAHRSATLARVDRDGTKTRVATVDLARPTLRLSPDGRRLALAGRRGGVAKLELLDLDRSATTTLTDLDVDLPAAPVWSPDGRALFYSRYGLSSGEIVRRDLERGTDEVLAHVPGTWVRAWSVSPDGRYLVFSSYDPERASDLWLLDLERAPAADAVRPWLATQESELSAAISPDGNWLAYTQEGSQGERIFAERFPSGGEKTLLADRWGIPLWSHDGREIFVVDRDPEGVVLSAVPVTFSPTLRVGEERRLFTGHYLDANDMGRSWDEIPASGAFLMVESGATGSATSYSETTKELVVVENWFREVRELAGGGPAR